MKKRITGLLILSALLSGTLFAHSGKPKFHVIIDTDGAIDDMRAISMLLSGNDIRVLAITCSRGTLAPESVFLKVNALLSAFHHEGIPAGVSSDHNSELPAWNSFARGIQWANEDDSENLNDHHNSLNILSSAIEDYKNKVTLIALGSLKTYADWIRANRKAAGSIERIIWYNDLNIKEGFNYKVSPDSYDFIVRCGIDLEVVANSSGHFPVNQGYLDHIRNAGIPYASQIEIAHSQAQVLERINARHLHLWDDMVPLYLTAPLLFDIQTRDHLRLASISQNIPPEFVYETIGKLLKSAASSNNRVFKDFPADTALYKPEYARMANSVISKFGPVEWKSICMTNEIHGHTGIYSIIGAKMGIRAMEYFNVGVNNMEVITFAGHIPPLSCLNDGIQISTGATIGQGLISVSDSIWTAPSASFLFNNRRVSLALRPEIARQMRKDIEYGIANYGLLTENYWMYIEQLAIKYWAEFDRHNIFVIEKM